MPDPLPGLIAQHEAMQERARAQDFSLIELHTLTRMGGIEVQVDDALPDGEIAHSPSWRYVKCNKKMFEALKRMTKPAR